MALVSKYDYLHYSLCIMYRYCIIRIMHTDGCIVIVIILSYLIRPTPSSKLNSFIDHCVYILTKWPRYCVVLRCAVLLCAVLCSTELH